MSQCLLGLVHKFKYPPMVSVTPYMFSMKSTTLSGSLLYPAFAPSADLAYSQTMNFQQRLASAFVSIFELAFDKFYIMPMFNKHVQRVHPGIPKLEEIEQKATKIILINTNPITDHKQPTFPNVKLVGGAQIQLCCSHLEPTLGATCWARKEF